MSNELKIVRAKFNICLYQSRQQDVITRYVKRGEQFFVLFSDHDIHDELILFCIGVSGEFGWLTEAYTSPVC